MDSIPIKEATLFLNSEIRKDFPWLEEIISKNTSHSLTKKDFKLLNRENREFLKQKWGEVFNRTQEEWRVTKRFEKNNAQIEIDCQLCGHKQLDWLSEIENIYNNNKLIVGSTCIEKFNKIHNNNHEDVKNQKRLLREKAKILLNEEMCEKRFTNMLELVKKFKEIPNMKTIILNDDMHILYKKTKKIVEEDYEKQLILPSNKIDWIKIKCAYDYLQEFFVKFNKYASLCENHEWGINSKIARWCYKNNKNELIQILQRFGKINEYTIDQIFEENFLKETIKKFVNFFESSNISIIETSISTNYFEIYIPKRKDIKIVVDNKEFISQKKKDFFKQNKSQITIESILSISKVNRDSFDKALQYICRNRSLYLNFKPHNSDVSLNELSFINQDNKNIYILNFNSFIQGFKYYIYMDRIDRKNNQKIIDYIENHAKVYEPDEYALHVKRSTIRSVNMKDFK